MPEMSDKTLEQARELIEMVSDEVEHDDFEHLIKLADLRVQLSIAESLFEIAKNGVYIAPS